MSRAAVLRKVLAVEPMYRDEIFPAMGGDRAATQAAIAELQKSGDLPRVDPTNLRTKYKLTAQGQARAFTATP